MVNWFTGAVRFLTSFLFIVSVGGVIADDHGSKKGSDSGYDLNKLGEIQSTVFILNIFYRI